MGTKRTRALKPFSLFGKTRTAILALLFGRGEETLYLRQIVRAVGAGLGAVQRELKILSDAGILERFERDKQVYYRANPRCPIAPELKNLMSKTEGLAGIVAASMAPLADAVDLAFVYGSQAEGAATAASDIDLMVVGDMDEMALHRAMTKAEQALRRAVNYTLMTRQEFDRRRREKGGFVARVLAGPKIAIIGDADEIR